MQVAVERLSKRTNISLTNGFLASAILIIISFIGASLLFSYTKEPASFLYTFSLGILLVVFFIINDFKIVSINTALVVYLFISIMLAPIFFWILGHKFATNPFVLLAGFALILLGMFIHKFKKNNSLPRANQSSIIIDRNNRTLFVFLFYLVGIGAAVYYFIKNRALLSGDINAGRMEAMSSTGIFVLLIGSLCISVAMLFELVLKKKLNVFVFLVLAGAAIVLSYVVGFKSFPLTIVFVLALQLAFSRKLSIKLILIIAVAAVMLFILLQTFRVSRSDVMSSGSIESTLWNFSVNYDNFERVINWFPKNAPFQNGHTYLINFEMLRPGPDVDFTMWLKQTLEMDFEGGGVTATIFGELYINWSYIGIIFGSIIFGFLSSCFDGLYSRKGSIWWVAFLCWQFVHSVSGGIGNVLLYTLIWLIMGLVVDVFTRRRVYIKRII